MDARCYRRIKQRLRLWHYYINGDQNSIQVEPDKPTDVTFKDGDTITFQFAGNGDNDKLTLDQK